MPLYSAVRARSIFVVFLIAALTLSVSCDDISDYLKKKEKAHWRDLLAKAGTDMAAIQELVARQRQLAEANRPIPEEVRSELEGIFFEHPLSVYCVSYAREFLTHFPDSSYSDKARRRLEVLSGMSSRYLRESSKVSVIVRQAYAFAPSFDFPFEEVAQRLLECAGMEAVLPEADRAEASDAVLMIEISGHPLGKDYDEEGFLYTGCRLRGRISLESKARTIAEARVDEKMEPVDKLGLILFGEFQRLKDPSLAPFPNLMAQSYLPELLKVARKTLGRNVVVAALLDNHPIVRRSASYLVSGDEAVPALVINLRHDERDYVREAAAEALGRIKATQAIEPLIASLEDWSIEDASRRSLRSITGERLSSKNDWERWWEENKGKYQRAP